MDVKHFNTRLNELETAYNNIKPLWQELSDYLLPRQARFLATNVNKTPASSKKIKDSTINIAVRNFSSGMMSGATSPSRKWFKLSISNFNQSDDYAVKSWCANVTTLFRDIYNVSNLYQNLPTVYKQLGVFGISVLSLEKDFDTVIRIKVLPIGSYKIAKDSRGVVNTLYRIYMETAQNLVEKFGEENCSEAVKQAVKNNSGQTPFEIIHAVEPNREYKQKSAWAKNKKFVSVYYERGSSQGFLNQSGFDAFPYIVFEADVNGEDVYPSDCPGIIALPDIKQLMTMVVEDGKAVKKIVSPTYRGPKGLKNRKTADNPGSFIEEDENGRGLSAVYEVNTGILNPLEIRIEKIKNTIGQIFYNDLFAMMVSSDRRQITATEIDERREEKMVLLSPLLEQIHTGLKQLMDWTFSTCLEAGIIPPPPEQIQGSEVKIEFVSTLAQAQKAANIGSMERFVTFVANMSATVDPSLRMKIDGNEMIDDYADYANIEPDQVVPTEIVEQQKVMIAQKEAQQQAMANIQQGSEIVKNMGGTDSSGGNLLERVGII